MKLSTKTFNLITYVSLAILVLLLLGMLTKVIPPQYYMHTLLVAIVIFILRIILRIQMFQQSKSKTENEK
ncbi:hypothetical protein JGI7_00118 [Candidatus Kryptonium thompsonii]|uniref:Uncharacterized protein n=1 Tax=Candidatus Kryptonium thompsonii TaxID=1633631 RepID=A0A0P1LEE9_9BACT|nr:hypothetical protein JGI7_00118 [Candidatus Kryptonium thompsoni]CUS79892.1 hypothetical protein JGI14_10075 [Candidatus Kryptonium thompsoni]CUS80782.1 hypothetical protein JGI16_10307 [Candidatus Kryptonium thompsoni]CUS80848.1 hypothetical protein JGI15_100928 [Candidatus Kryptonium thompsoni]CUS82071.1 hypothetical protein JGI12_00548 [Candidatus Kryptonium thompsoni]